MSRSSDKKWFERERASAMKSDEEERRRNKTTIDNWNKKYPNYDPKNNTKKKASSGRPKRVVNTNIPNLQKPPFSPSKIKQVNIQDVSRTMATNHAKNHRQKTNAGELSKIMDSGSKNSRMYNQIRGSKSLDRIGNATKGTVKNTGSSFMNAFATLNADANTSSIKRHDLKAGYARDKDRKYGGKNRSVKSESQRKQETKSYEKRVDELRGYQDAGRKPIQEKASQIRASGNADIEKAKKGLGKGGKFGIDLYSQMLQWGGDAVIGAATGTGILAPMFFRSFGDTSMTARELGASRNKQILAGAVSGSVEAATEKIFSPFEIMKKTAGKGLLDNVAERTAYNLTKKLTKQGVSKELTYKIVKNAIKAGAGMIEEGSEEVASSLFQPAYESIYDKNALEQYKHPIKTGYLKQIGSDFTMGAAMAGVLGGGGAIVNKAKGNTPQETFTESEKKQIIKAGKAQGEKTDTYSLAVNLEKQQASGEDVLNGQIADLANKVYQEQYNTEKAIIEQADIAEKEYVQNLQTTAGSTDMMKNDRRINGPVEQVMVDQVVAKRVAEKASDIESLMVANGEDAQTAKAVSAPIARIVLGTATAQDMTVAAVGNNGPRAIIEAQTGVKLPYTNQETINALSVYAAGMKAMQKEGIVKEARQEARAMASQLLTTNLDEQTATIFNKGMENLNFNSLPQYVEGFNLYYQGGTVNYDYGKILKTYDKVLPESVKMAAYNAGNQVYLAEQAQVKEAQKKVVKSERRNGSLVMSEKHQKKLGSEKSGALRTFVEVSGKKVVVVDQIDAGKHKDVANGKYKDGTIFISAKSDNPIFDVLKHELTHNLQETAPEAYNELKQFVFKRFYEADQKKYDALVSGMIDRYAQSGVELTRSQAEDELLADATDVFFKDADMIQSLVNENRSLAEKLVKGIRALLDTLHRMATGNKKGDWLETIGIVEEAQRLWVKALNESIGVEQIKAVTSETSATVTGVRYMLKDDSEMDDKDRESVSYNKLISKPNMHIVTIIGGRPEMVSRKDTVRSAIDNVKKTGHKDRSDRNVIVNKDTGRSIVVGRNSIEHGLGRKTGDASAVAEHIGEYVKNAVKVNVLEPRGNAVGGYVLLGYGQSDEGVHYPAYFVVETLETGIDEITYFDSLYSVKAKKIEAPTNGRSFQAPTSISTISIQNLLELVNGEFSDILSSDVLQHFNIERRETKLGQSVKFQLRDSDDDLQKKVSELEKTNKKLKAEFKRSKYAEPNPKQAGIAVSRLIEAYLGRRDGLLHNSVMPDVKQVFAEMRRYEGNWNLIDDLCLNVADKVVDKMEILHDEMWTQYKDLRDTLSGTTLKLSENYWNDIADFEELRKSYFGTVKLAKKSGIPIDTFYQELAETYPELFDAQEYTNEVDQMYNILEAVESMKPYVEECSKGEVSEFKEQIAKDVLQMAYDLSQKKTFADLKHDEKLLAVEKVKAERNSLMDKQKVRMQSRLDKKDKFYKSKISDIRQKYKDTKSKKYYTSRIEAYTQWMSESLLRPTETKHIPDGYAKAIATMLSGFDFSTTKTDNWTRKYGASIRTIKLAELRNEYEKMSKNEDSTIEIDEELQELLNQLSADLDGKRFSDLSIEELDGVYRIIKQVRFSLSKMNKTFSDGLKDNVSQYGDAIISDNMSRKNKKQYDGLRGEVNRFLNEANVTPIDMFECVGGKMYELYQNMRRGFDRHVDNVSQSKDFISSITEKYKVKKWIDDNARAKKFKLENGSTIELVPSQVMSLYCLVDRKQAIDHILGSGVTASPIGVIDKNRQRLTKGIAKRRLSDAQVMPTINDVKNIVNTLTTEQKEVADALQKFMGDTCSEWGNETSLRLYGYKKFTEKNYFPIKSSDAFLDESFDKVQAAKIKNVGFTKNTVMNASNPIVLDDIFNVFSHHVNTMSMYNALVPALTDFERVYNYKQRSNDGKIVATVQKSIQQSYGDNVNRYIRRFVNDVNQNYAKNDDNNISSRLIANYKKAKIGANLRVLVQQPTAIVRAGTVMNPIYLVAPGKISLKEMQEHCQIARWKSWGFYNTDVSRSMRDIFLNKRNIVDTLFMEMYGKADDFTWSVIWNGVKKEIKARRKDLKPGTDAYWKAVNERFSYVVDRTQVVDSVFHRSQIMRSHDLFSKITTSFMAEPTKTFNMLRTELVLARKDLKGGNKKRATGRVMRVTSVYIANAVSVSMAAALIDALRARGDDDEDKDYLERWQDYILENFKDNANFLNLLPLLRDVGSMIQGYDVSRMDMDGIADLVNSIIMWESDTYTLVEKVKSMVGAVSSVTGLPIGNVTRDVEAMAKEAAKHFFPKEYVGYFVARFKYDITNEDNRSKFMAYYIKAVKNGNTDVAKLIEDDMKTNGIDSEYMRGQITTAFSDEFNSAVESNDTDKIEIEADKLVEAGIDRATVDKKVKNALGSACNDALENEDLGTAYEIISTMEEYGFDQNYIERKKRDLAVNEIASYIRIGRTDRAYADAYDYHNDYGWQVNALIERAEKIAYGN